MGTEKYAGLTRKSGKRYVWTGEVRLDEKALTIPLQWKKSRRVFVNSMSDLFHEDIPNSFIRKIWEVMKATPRHTYQILTKRPDRMAKIVGAFDVLPNVWLGTSVESSEFLFRIDDLRSVPAAVRFISFEPLLGSVADADLTKIHWAIVGGESGPRARAMSEEWVREVETACRSADVAFFFKQWGGKNKKRTGRLLNGRTFDEMPRLIEYAASQNSS